MGKYDGMSFGGMLMYAIFIVGLVLAIYYGTGGDEGFINRNKKNSKQGFRNRVAQPSREGFVSSSFSYY